MNRFTLALVLLICLPIAPTNAADEPRPMTLPPHALSVPDHTPAPDFQADGVKAIFFDGLPWKGKPTRVFAWVGVPKLEPGKKAPGIVLVHGGGGTAFDSLGAPLGLARLCRHRHGHLRLRTEGNLRQVAAARRRRPAGLGWVRTHR